MGWYSLIPAMLAIALALWKREVILALVAALLSAEVLLAQGNPAAGAAGLLDRLLATLADAGNARILMFSLLMGALLKLLRDSGGVDGFVNRLSRAGLTKTPRQAGLLASSLGLLIFIESNLSVLTAGIVSQKLFDRFRMSRVRLAYLIDATCAPGRVTIPLNAWGAFILGLIGVYNLPNPTETLLLAIPLNFYAMLTLGLVFFTAISGKTFGPLAQVEKQLPEPAVEALSQGKGKARFMVIPLVVLVFGIVAFMALTGQGSLLKGSGSTSVLWATCLALLVLYGLLRGHGVFRHQELIKRSFAGMSELLPLVTTVLLAMSLGAAMKALGTGEFVAGLVGPALPKILICPFIFLAAATMSFTTGTSWGTFAIMMPLAMPLGISVGLPPPLVLSAVLGGGVFGDHCSPISDTTIVAALASGCDLLDHTRTQLPYALTAAGGAFVFYLVAGLMV
ncbi:MAG: sodium:proton antiporter [Gammaproteobacteria bacterium]|nr:sodium:proton antiporter [Gammaproteobacteria bacterium]